jgi:hypothetical protein
VVDFLSRQAYKDPRHGALRSLITDIEQNCPKTPPISHYQGNKAR